VLPNKTVLYSVSGAIAGGEHWVIVAAETDAIPMPASVWDVVRVSSGDLVAATGNGHLAALTRDPSRRASADEEAQHLEKVGQTRVDGGPVRRLENMPRVAGQPGFAQLDMRRKVAWSPGYGRFISIDWVRLEFGTVYVDVILEDGRYFAIEVQRCCDPDAAEFVAQNGLNPTTHTGDRALPPRTGASETDVLSRGLPGRVRECGCDPAFDDARADRHDDEGRVRRCSCRSSRR
jgi:hypothetical protein